MAVSRALAAEEKEETALLVEDLPRKTLAIADHRTPARPMNADANGKHTARPMQRKTRKRRPRNYTEELFTSPLKTVRLNEKDTTPQ